MHAPNTNPHLSGLARATWMLFATVGRVMSSSEIQEGNYKLKYIATAKMN